MTTPFKSASLQDLKRGGGNQLPLYKPVMEAFLESGQDVVEFDLSAPEWKGTQDAESFTRAMRTVIKTSDLERQVRVVQRRDRVFLCKAEIVPPGGF